MKNLAYKNRFFSPYGLRVKSFIEKANEWLVVLLAICLTYTTAGISIFSTLLIILFCFSGQWSDKIKYLKNFNAVKYSLLLFLLFLLGCCYSSASWHDIITRLSKYSKLLLIPVLIYAFKNHSLRQKALGAFTVVMSLILFLQ